MSLLVEEHERQPRGLTLAFNVAGFCLVGYSLLKWSPLVDASIVVWTWWIACLSLLAWIVRTLAAHRGAPAAWSAWAWLRDGCDWVMVLAGSATAAEFSAVTLIPPLIVILIVVADIGRPLWLGLLYAAVTTVVATIGALSSSSSVVTIVSVLCGVVVASLIGISRRQYRANDTQARLLRERDLMVRQERARLQLLADRQAAARDIHDVLAHSLGGLVIQLDAVEALLESGDIRGAERRVSDARALAASGLDDARRAVAALRDEQPSADAGRLAGVASALSDPSLPAASLSVPPLSDPSLPAASLGSGGALPPESSEETPAQQLSRAFSELIDTHRSLGGAVEFVSTGAVGALDAPSASALRRALQESLSNARKHSPGSVVQIHLDWTGDSVTLTVENPLAGQRVGAGGSGRGARADAPGSSPAAVSLAAAGGGHGLNGMRERFDALPNGGSARAAAVGSVFVVVATARLA